MRTPTEAIGAARALLAAQRPYYAHEVLEEQWKAARAADRPLWQGLAQLAVGLTHLQRGNRVGAARLLRRGAGLLSAMSEASGDLGPGAQEPDPVQGAGSRPATSATLAAGIEIARVVRDALELATAIEADEPTKPLML